MDLGAYRVKLIEVNVVATPNCIAGHCKKVGGIASGPTVKAHV